MSPSAARFSRPAAPDPYGSPSGPSRRAMTSVAATATTAPPTARRRAGAAAAGGVVRTAAAPALVAAPAANTNGRIRRASCHTGTAVFASSAAV